MKTLDFDYDYPVSTASYKGYKVEAIHDDCAENPFLEWDCEPCVMVKGDRWSETWNDDTGIDEPLTRQQIIDNLPAILDMLSEPSLLSYARDYYLPGNGYDLVDMLNESISECLYESLENRAEVLSWQGIVSMHTTILGSCQSDWWECLIIASPGFLKTSGAKIETENDLKGTRELLEAYLTGNVYGYAVEAPDGEVIDGCYGYYGDFDESGLSEAAIDAIECDITARRRAKQSRLKELIRNHVPLMLRENKLQS